MKYAVISDVHSNLEALETALAEIQKRRADQLICLGDVVGYGANPSECLKNVCEAASVVVMGNHDRAVFDVPLRDRFVDWARTAIEWTAGVLSNAEKKMILGFPPLVIDQKAGATWMHASLDEPNEYHYLFSDSDARPSFKLSETDFCFFGHTHIPSLFSEKTGGVRRLSEGVVSLLKGDRFLLNPGSVGQPRDKNPKLSFGVFDSEDRTFEIVRLDYDNRKAAAKIRKAGLPSYLADRLL